MAEAPAVKAETLAAVAHIKPVGEFGSKAWCVACAEGGMKLLEDANLPKDIEWGFSEIYTHPPARLMEGGREQCGYYMLVKNGKITGGDGATDEVRSTVGFNIEARWAAICNQSSSLYNSEGAQQRTADELVLYAAMEEYVGRPNPLERGGGPERIWFPEINAAFGKNGGLHNIAASMQSPSPEYADLPTTVMRVPDFGAMSDEQKQFFVKLCGVEL